MSVSHRSGRNVRIAALGLLTLGVALAVYLLPPLVQDPAYHQFADRRTIVGLSNGLNVWSNLAFVAVGVRGMVCLARQACKSANSFPIDVGFWPYGVFFASIALIGPGSAYYHLAPDNARLVWDRLPMAISFAALVAIMIAERVSPKLGLWSLLPLVGLGVGSVIYWRLSAFWGQENLWPYVAVQFYGLTLVLLFGCCFPPRYSHGYYFLIALGLYGVAKLAEHFDGAILHASQAVSGHTLKHLLAALAVYAVLRMLERRRPLALGGTEPNSPSL